jgi:hypothetical protein
MVLWDHRHMLSAILPIGTRDTSIQSGHHCAYEPWLGKEMHLCCEESGDYEKSSA